MRMSSVDFLVEYAKWVGQIATTHAGVRGDDISPEEYVWQLYKEDEAEVVSGNLIGVRIFLETFYRTSRVAKFLAELTSE